MAVVAGDSAPLIETIHFFDWWEGRTRGSFLKVGKYTERVDADPPSCLAVVLEYLAVELGYLLHGAQPCRLCCPGVDIGG
ncbi:hypothetical protein P8452_32559 [Trifolium repens]|nr:hypothetical protein P8452_07393 [Trifolium repens]WJX45697.1 hypothetical protein P8452_32559 [Trifolium repens]